jgi:hypothetical protein
MQKNCQIEELFAKVAHEFVQVLPGLEGLPRQISARLRETPIRSALEKGLQEHWSLLC